MPHRGNERAPLAARELLWVAVRYAMIALWSALVVFDLIWTITGHERLAPYGTIMSAAVVASVALLAAWVRRSVLDGQAALIAEQRELHVEIRAELARIVELAPTQPIMLGRAAVYRSPAAVVDPDVIHLGERLSTRLHGVSDR